MQYSAFTTHRHINKDVETLRALAILCVLFHHFGSLVVGPRVYGLYSETFGLWSGVDLFLCISGFIIAKGYYYQLAHANERPSSLWVVAKSFWVRRAFRLWPSAWLWAVLTGLLFTLEGTGSLRGNLNDALTAVLGVANLHWWQCLNGRSVCGGLGFYWSLSLEEQFYWLFPALFLLKRRWQPWALAAIVAAQFFIPRAHWTPQLLPFFRTDAIALGILVFLFTRTGLYQRLTPYFLGNRLLGVVALGVWFVVFCTVSTPERFPGRAIVPFATGLVALFSAMLVYVASYDRDWILNFRVVRPLMLWIGARSYALYLIQAFAVHATRDAWSAVGLEQSGTARVLFAIAVFGGMAVLAELNFRFVESPLRTRGRTTATSLPVSGRTA